MKPTQFLFCVLYQITVVIILKGFLLQCLRVSNNFLPQNGITSWQLLWWKLKLPLLWIIKGHFVTMLRCNYNYPTLDLNCEQTLKDTWQWELWIGIVLKSAVFMTEITSFRLQLVEIHTDKTNSKNLHFYSYKN